MNTLLKIAIGWVVWNAGVQIFAHLTTNAIPSVSGATSAVEFANGAMMAAYLFGVPILTTLWILGESDE